MFEIFSQQRKVEVRWYNIKCLVTFNYIYPFRNVASPEGLGESTTKSVDLPSPPLPFPLFDGFRGVTPGKCFRKCMHADAFWSIFSIQRSAIYPTFLPTHGWQANESVLTERCRLSVCNDRALRPNGDRSSHDFYADWQGVHLAMSGTKQHWNRSSRFRAVADLVALSSVEQCKPRLHLENGAT